MQTPRRFTIHERSTILKPGADGIEALADCLRHGHSPLARQSQHRPIIARQSREQALFCETSGTSGGAKTIKRRPASWIRSFEINQRAFGLGPNDTCATFGHPGHSLSLYAIVEALHVGADVLPLSGLLPKTQAAELTRHQVSILYATPTQLGLLIDGAEASGIRDIPSVRHVFSGGGKLDDARIGPLLQLFPNARIREFFGASETSFISITDAGTPKGSVGRPYPGVTLEIRADAPAGPMETGEIWVSSPYLFEGYEGAGSPDTRWDGKYLSIGEMGHLDAQGYLFLRGRRNRMVTVADKNVFPEEIEKALTSLPQVRRCAALAQPDEKRGHRILCVIEGQPDDGLEKLMRQKCREELGAHTAPHRFVFVDKIPLLGAGKPDLQALSHLSEPTV